MSTKPSNRSGSHDQGAFGDQDKQEDKRQTETHLDDDSTLYKFGDKKPLHTSQKQSEMDNDKPIDRKDD